MPRKKSEHLTPLELENRMFGGSAESFVMSLAETRRLTPAKLAKLQKLLEQGSPDDRV